MGANCNLDGSKKQLKKGGQETNGCSLVARVIFSLLKLQICREHFVLEKRALAFSIISMCTELAVTKKTISYSIMWLFGIIMQSSKGLLKVSKTAAVFNVNGVKRKKTWQDLLAQNCILKITVIKMTLKHFFMYSVLSTQFASMKTEESHLEISEVEWPY